MPSEGSQFESRKKQRLSWLFSASPSKHEIEPQIRLVSLPSTWFSDHYSLVILWTHAVWSELLMAPLNKP